ncbi:MAG: 5'-methylthioadenosine/S-adenosylhomocysteine nucleosidase [Bacilli bacterium]|jgi:adenosylhomocysteine nucleosidase|nr:5'-methylthioadenosine/S-adenosylhomocysteine nucleosidase [Bacilli bacterium]MCH4210276.1 5'-methylthioadenosine/S-adenosylhomocysteine nucleosidase [Bacilli bacterium]MCH4228192.1 5'-methylthioadenosine/S-adenosylhomocysteine nucleosidase [Bacilli bacterium]MCH4277454.1 5'-methylthioadenosine/S-adenosylhomocysteine nucleosidase [Bacilli bacterium]MCI2054644.1 5'-methylthioadenosine/S-adenosylhomocysteine nucleosidase [Bacilli bacterium]
MIAILASTQDEILYFVSRMNVTTKTKIYGNIEANIGTLSNEEVILAVTGESNYLSELVSAVIIERYRPYLVINVGLAVSFSPSLRQGDIFVAERYYFADVNFTKKGKYLYGQIPGCSPYFVSDTALNEETEHSAYSLSDRYIQRGFLLSGNEFINTQGPLEKLVGERFLSEEGLMAYDNVSAGIALSCEIGQVSLLTVKSIACRVGKEDERLNYLRKGLEVMPTIGQIVARILLSKER